MRANRILILILGEREIETLFRVRISKVCVEEAAWRCLGLGEYEEWSEYCGFWRINE